MTHKHWLKKFFHWKERERQRYAKMQRKSLKDGFT